MPVRVFTLAEANELLPAVEQAILVLQDVVRRMGSIEDALGVLDVLGAADERSPEHPDLLGRRAEREDAMRAFNEQLDRIQQLGCVLKDVHAGVADFYGLKDGRLIFYCWRMGEDAIRYWHEIDSGMIGRRPVSEL